MTEKPNRTDPQRHRDQVRAGNRAKTASVNRLIAEFRDRYDEIAEEEWTKEGIEYQGSVKTRRRKRIARLEAQLAELRAEDEEDDG